ncbi:mono/diheme cytochrome c family protein [Sphingomonas naasensis]|uniref:Isoquinoline 1-oxidoreductase subunit n=1 Tax=Sphingomonas naasensis TaxID=1344951 RepID=A0A4S1WMZ0_9SPHN|nr:Isoquinoline 1-oxidoreductase subunit [Sphingomonas naasensis]NIJ21791.1 mono/diheme cytochrome c family protein [Sphingomonas naasensis]TGX42506.1 Isoquinoline 1-oxidoreductase subunit [Sphingomonas naasensis]
MKAGALALGAAALTLGIAIAGQAREQKVEGLRPVSAFAGIADPGARSVAIFTEMGKVIQHPRCVNCHPRTDRPLQGDAQLPHDPPVSRGPADRGMAGLECGTCHGPRNVAFANGKGSVPGHPEWHAAPIAMAWEGKTLGQICQQIKDRKRNGGKSLDQIAEHNAHDSLVGWGWNPGPGRTPVPGTQAQFGELTRAWVASGAKCPAG